MVCSCALRVAVWESTLQACRASEHLHKVDGNDPSLPPLVLGQVPEDHIAGLQDTETVSLGEGQVVRMFSWEGGGGGERERERERERDLKVVFKTCAK